MDLTYGMLVYEGMAELDLIGPLQVFDISASLIGGSHPVTVAKTMEPIRGISNVCITPDCCFADAPDLDVLLIPGSKDEDLESVAGDRVVLDWIRAQAEKVQYITSVCTGAILLQRTGILKNRKATTHWMLIEALQRDETITVLPEARYVCDGKVVTAQGVSAGIDMALWLVGQIHSPEHARMVRKILQYDPAPPYTAEICS